MNEPKGFGFRHILSLGQLPGLASANHEAVGGPRYRAVIVTNIPDTGIKGVPGSHHAQFIDVLHRQHAVVEDGVRAGKSMGLRNLPSKT